MGLLKTNETFWEGALREAREEIGPDAKLRPLGSVHIGTFQYDPNASHMLSLSVLFAYEGGEIKPDDDMKDAKYGWFSADELINGDMTNFVPSGQTLYRKPCRRTISAMERPILPPGKQYSHR